MDRFVIWVTRRPGWTLAAVLALTVLAATRVIDPWTGEVRLRFDPSLNRLLPEDDERRVFYDHVRQLFGNDENLVVAYATEEGVFTPEHLANIRRISERLAELDGVHHVLAVTNAVEVRASPTGDVAIAPMVGAIPETEAGLAALRRRAENNPLYAGNLISRDGRAAALSVHLAKITESEFLTRGLDREIARVARAEAGGAEIWLTGGPYIKAATTRIVVRDVGRILPLALFLMAAVAALAFRSVAGVGVPLIAITAALVWTLAAVAESGRSLTLVTVVIPPLILSIGFAYTVHVLTALRETRRRGEEPTREVVARALRRVVLPVALTGLTTAAGLVALVASPLVAIREFGVFGVLATGFTALSALVLAPALLALLPLPGASERDGSGGLYERAARGFGSLVTTHRVPVLAAAVLVAALSAWGMTRIVVSSDLLGNFRPDDPVVRDFHAVNDHLEGANLFYVVFEGEERGALLEPDALREMRSVQEWMEAQPEIGGTSSLADFVMLVNRAFHDGDERHYAIPDSKRMVTQLLFFAASDELGRFVDLQYRTAAIVVRARATRSEDVRALFARTGERLAEVPPELAPRITGNSALVIETMDELSGGQVISLSVAFALIYAILAALFTSLRVGFLALLPNALPVLIYFGTMGAIGATLNPTTSLIACLVLGIAVDDTIHFLVRFNENARRMADERSGTVETLVAIGRPVTITTAALCLGFLAAATSDLKSQMLFGSLAAFTLAAAWLVDVTLTPALCSRLRIVTLWEVLTLDLGHDPQESIPLFRGLSNAQARTVALMSEIHELPARHALFRAGEEGEDMYVVLDGELEVTQPSDTGAARRANLTRGDVLGEVALVLGRRQSDAHTVRDSRLLRFSESDLARLRRRYPRAGRRFLQNLSDLLLDRLEDLARDQRLGLMRFVCSFAWADSRLARDERRFIGQLVERLDLDPDERRQVHGWLEAPPPGDPPDAASVPLEHRLLFVESLQALILADGEIHPEELAALRPLIR